MEKVAVVLSTPMLLEPGNFSMSEITIDQAKAWVAKNNPTNFVGHSTIRVLGIEPAATRDVCGRYDSALSLKVNGRLDYGREYTVEDILDIGVTCYLIVKSD